MKLTNSYLIYLALCAANVMFCISNISLGNNVVALFNSGAAGFVLAFMLVTYFESGERQ